MESVRKLIEGTTEAAQAGEEKMSRKRKQSFVLQAGGKFLLRTHREQFLLADRKRRLIKKL